MIVKRVANTLNASHPSTKDKDQDDKENKFDLPVKLLLEYGIAGLPLPYLITLKIAQDILDCSDKLQEPQWKRRFSNLLFKSFYRFNVRFRDKAVSALFLSIVSLTYVGLIERNILMEMTFGILGIIGFVFGLAALSKVTKLEKEIKERGLLDADSE